MIPNGTISRRFQKPTSDLHSIFEQKVSRSTAAEEVELAFAILGNEGVQMDQCANAIGYLLCDTTSDATTIRLTAEHDVRDPLLSVFG